MADATDTPPGAPGAGLHARRHAPRRLTLGPVLVTALIGWLAHLGWSCEQIVAVLLVLLPPTGAPVERA